MGVLRAIGVLITSILLTLGVLATDVVYYLERVNLLESYPALAELGVVESLSLALPVFVLLMVLLLYLGTRSVRTVARGLGMSLLAVGVPPVALSTSRRRCSRAAAPVHSSRNSREWWRSSWSSSGNSRRTSWIRSSLSHGR